MRMWHKVRDANVRCRMGRSLKNSDRNHWKTGSNILCHVLMQWHRKERGASHISSNFIINNGSIFTDGAVSKWQSNNWIQQHSRHERITMKIRLTQICPWEVQAKVMSTWSYFYMELFPSVIETYPILPSKCLVTIEWLEQGEDMNNWGREMGQFANSWGGEEGECLNDWDGKRGRRKQVPLRYKKK